MIFSYFLMKHVDQENSYLCGYLKIKGLTEEFPTLTTFFDGEIISKRFPFLTRKWDADEDVDKKHWVNKIKLQTSFIYILSSNLLYSYRANSWAFISMPRSSTLTLSTTTPYRRRISSLWGGRSISWFQIIPSKTLTAPPLPAFTTFASKRAQQPSRATIITAVQSGINRSLCSTYRTNRSKFTSFDNLLINFF